MTHLYNDSSLLGYSYGKGRVLLRWDDERSSMVAVFDGKSRVEVNFDSRISLTQLNYRYLLIL